MIDELIEIRKKEDSNLNDPVKSSYFRDGMLYMLDVLKKDKWISEETYNVYLNKRIKYE